MQMYYFRKSKLRKFERNIFNTIINYLPIHMIQLEYAGVEEAVLEYLLFLYDHLLSISTFYMYKVINEFSKNKVIDIILDIGLKKETSEEYIQLIYYIIYVYVMKVDVNISQQQYKRILKLHI